jgi:hypothetical protein
MDVQQEAWVKHTVTHVCMQLVPTYEYPCEQAGQWE